MEDIAQPEKITEEERQLRQYKQETRELFISNARSNVVKSQITQAYGILENIRFDHISDTAFRDKVTQAKRNLESALHDFLLSEAFWEKSIKTHQGRTPAEYDEHLKSPATQSGQSD